MSTKEISRPAVASATSVKPSSTRAPVAKRTPFDILQSEIDRVFDSFSAWQPFSERAFLPSMEVTETDAAIEVTAELPGMDDKDVDISVSDGLLTIRGEKKFEKDEKKKDYRLIERSYGAFERSVALPQGVDATKVKATMAKGVLKIEIPKPAEAKARQIRISNAT